MCDATWSSGYMNYNDSFIKDYNDGYFLTEPLLFAQNHYPIEKQWLLDETLIESGFIASPIVYSETFKHKIIPVNPNKLYSTVKKSSEVIFSFKSLKTISINDISLVKASKNEYRRLNIESIQNKSGVIQFKHKFKNKGTFDIHLKIDKDIVTSYSVNVVK